MFKLQVNRVFALRHSNYSEKLRWTLELSGEQFQEVRSCLEREYIVHAQMPTSFVLIPSRDFSCCSKGYSTV